MSEISKRLQHVRQIAKSHLTEIVGEEAAPVESILVAGSRYYGHRFKFRTHTAEWLLEKDQLHITKNETGETVNEIDLAQETDRAVVWPNAA